MLKVQFMKFVPVHMLRIRASVQDTRMRTGYAQFLKFVPVHVHTHFSKFVPSKFELQVQLLHIKLRAHSQTHQQFSKTTMAFSQDSAWTDDVSAYITPSDYVVLAKDPDYEFYEQLSVDVAPLTLPEELTNLDDFNPDELLSA